MAHLVGKQNNNNRTNSIIMDLRKRDWENIKLAIGIGCIYDDSWYSKTSDHSEICKVLERKFIDSPYLIGNVIMYLHPSHDLSAKAKEFLENENIDFDKARDFLKYVIKLKESSCGGEECELRYEYIDLLSSYFIPDIGNYLYGIYKVNDSDELRQIIFNSQPNANLNWVDVSDITDFSYLFKDRPDFNGDISLWNVANAVNMEGMFKNCSDFNCNINRWWMDGVLNAKGMFQGCTHFNQNISNWSIDNAETEDMFADCGIEESNKPNKTNEADTCDMVNPEMAAKGFYNAVASLHVDDAYVWRFYCMDYLKKVMTITQCFKTIHYDSCEFWKYAEDLILMRFTPSYDFFDIYLTALMNYSLTINNDAFGRHAEVIKSIASLNSCTMINSYMKASMGEHYVSLLETDPKPLYRILRMPYSYALLKLDLTKYITKDAMAILCDTLYKEPLNSHKKSNYYSCYNSLRRLLNGNEISNLSMSVVDNERKKLHKARQRSILKTSDNIISVKELCGLFNRHAKSPNKKPILLVYDTNDPYTIFYTSNTAESRKIETVKSDGNNFVFAPKYFDTPFVFYTIGRIDQPEAQEIKYAEWMADNCGDHTFFWVLHREHEIPESVKSKFDVYYIE